eukprot:6191732-Pleurochrysis_carterae.AAC.3
MSSPALRLCPHNARAAAVRFSFYKSSELRKQRSLCPTRWGRRHAEPGVYTAATKICALGTRPASFIVRKTWELSPEVARGVQTQRSYP